MSVYPSGHLMEFVRSNLPRDVLSCAAAESALEDKAIRMAGWSIARHHPKGRGGAVFITFDDETGDTQLFVRPDIYERRRALDGQVVIIRRTDATVERRERNRD